MEIQGRRLVRISGVWYVSLPAKKVRVAGWKKGDILKGEVLRMQ